jgi:hypothetical protein
MDQQPQYDPRQFQGTPVGSSAIGSQKPMPLIDSAIGRISMVSERLSSMVGVLREFTDSTRGAEPPTPSGPSSPSLSANSLPRGEVLQSKIDQLETVVQYLQNQLSRLQGI